MYQNKMKKIITILTLLGLTGNYLTATVMYEVGPNYSDQILSLSTHFRLDEAANCLHLVKSEDGLPVFYDYSTSSYFGQEREDIYQPE
jgi:hypothetical protein